MTTPARTVPTRAVIYARLSQDRTGEADNVNDQIEAGRRIATEKGWRVVEVYSDNNRPASDPKRKPRPEFCRMLEDAQQGDFDVVICRTADRLFRHSSDLQQLVDVFEPRGIFIHQEWSGFPLQMNDAQGLMMARMLAAMGTFELALKSKRQAATTRRLVAEGKPRKNVNSFGFNPDMTPHPVEAELVLQAYKHVASGKSLGSLVRTWNEAGIKTRRGGDWGYQSMRALLLRLSNAGIRQATVDGQVIEAGEASWAALVPRDLFAVVGSILNDSSRIKHRGETARKHLLSGLIHCTRCGSRMRAGSVVTRAGKKHEIYQCPGQKMSCRMSIDKETIERKVLAHVGHRVASPSGDMLALTSEAKADISGRHARVKELRSEIETVHLSGVSLSEKLRLIEEREAEISQLERQVANAVRREGLAGLLAQVQPATSVRFDEVVAAGKAVQAQFRSLDLNQQKQIIRSLCRVEVRPHPEGVRPTKATAADRITITPLNLVTELPQEEVEWVDELDAPRP